MRLTAALAGLVLTAACAADPHPPARTVQPSAAARVACGAEAFQDVEGAVGVAAAPLHPVWIAPTYSCAFVYPAGTMVVAVTDHASPAAAADAFAAGRPVGAVTIPALGQDAYARADGSAVVRKDSQVLTVDVSGLPAAFGTPPHPRNIQAIDVALVILTCWTES